MTLMVTDRALAVTGEARSAAEAQARRRARRKSLPLIARCGRRVNDTRQAKGGVQRGALWPAVVTSPSSSPSRSGRGSRPWCRGTSRFLGSLLVLRGGPVSAMPVPVLSSSLRFGSVSDQRENVAGNHFPA